MDVLAAGYDVVARFNGGANAGHTLVVDGKRFAFHLLPCGLLRPGCVNVVGGGVVVHLPTLEKELAAVRESGVEVDGSRLKVSDRAHLLFDFHQLVDGMRETELAEKSRQIGTTGKGIGPCYASKIVRNGIRVADLVHGDWEEFKMKYQALLEFFKRQHRFDFDGKEEMQRLEMQREMLREFVDDTAFYINDAYRCGKRILMEGANAAMLDIDFGTYPYVTSSSTTVGGISTGLGLSPDKIEACVGVVKAYTTRVGGGPFPTELHDAVGKHLGEVGREFGTT